MECRIYIDADCTHAEKIDITKNQRPEGDRIKWDEILNILQQDRVVRAAGGPVGGEKSTSDYEYEYDDTGYDRKMVDNAFCNLIERYRYFYIHTQNIMQ